MYIQVVDYDKFLMNMCLLINVNIVEDFNGGLIELQESYKRQPPIGIEFYKSIQLMVLSREFVGYVHMHLKTYMTYMHTYIHSYIHTFIHMHIHINFSYMQLCYHGT